MENITFEMIIQLIQDNDIEQLKYIFDEYNIVDLAEIVDELQYQQILYLFNILNSGLSAELFSYLSEEKQHKLLTLFTSDQLKNILDNLYADDIVDLLEELPSHIIKEILRSVTVKQRDTINKLLSYQDNTAGSIMTVDYIELDDTDTVVVAMEKIRQIDKIVETINYCYIVNKEKILVGIISLRDILFAPEHTVLKDIMNKDVISFKTEDDQEEVIKAISKYDITVVPIVDNHRRLVGIVTVDDALDVIEEEATEDIHKMGGIMPIEGSYLKMSSFKMSKSRLIWLLVLMISYAVSSLIITNNQAVLIAVPSLITFIPMLMDTAGNGGSQASAMVIRGIIVDDLTISDFYKVFIKELQVGMMCGVILFIVNTLRIVLFVPDTSLTMAIMVSLTIFIILIVAKLIGGLLPLFALIIKADPAAMASPVIATICDALSLTIYFALASVFFGL